jgi:hypothetical protein
MIKEKLIIKNFGPIKDVELELRSFNILIGDQGTGKSTIAKLLLSIRNTIFRDLFEIPDELYNRDTHLFWGHLKLTGIQNYLYEATEILYSDYAYSFEYKNQVATFEKVKVTVDELLRYDFTYIPSERNLIIPLANSLFALLETRTALPPLFLRFGDKFQKARKERESFDYSNTLGISYKSKETGDIIVLSSGKEIPIHESSSGIQGVIPLLTVFDFVSKTSPVYSITSSSILKTGNLLIIEEPELNCFPETQNKVVKYLIENNIAITVNNQNIYKNQILLTTHSPYVLTSLNNLLYSHQIGQNHPEQIEPIVARKYWLNPEDVSAYIMLPNGKCEKIIDNEGLIKAERIDSVSRKLNEEFDLLQDVELGIKN